MSNFINVDLFIYLGIAIAALYIKYRITIEIKDSCAQCSNAVNRPRKNGLYKIKFFLSLLSHAAVAMVVYHLLIK
jgi:hypothetical protein